MGKRTRQVGQPAKYQDICERLGHDLKAAACVLIVIDGRLGDGMSVSIDQKRPGAHELAYGGGLAGLLRGMADSIEGGQQPLGVAYTEFEKDN